jgi:hypothetical protein
MRNVSLLLVIVVTCVAAPRVKAEDSLIYKSGNVFLTQCSVVERPIKELTTDEDLDFVQCISYIRGLQDGISVERTVLLADTGARVVVCLPVVILSKLSGFLRLRSGFVN